MIQSIAAHRRFRRRVMPLGRPGGFWPKPGDPNPRKQARKNPAPYTGRSCYGARGLGLLVGHGDLEPVLCLDEMVVAVAADIDLYPVDLAGEFVADGPVVG